MKKFAIVFTVIALSISCGKKELTQEENQIEGSVMGVYLRNFGFSDSSPGYLHELHLKENGVAENWFSEGGDKNQREKAINPGVSWEVKGNEILVTKTSGDIKYFIYHADAEELIMVATTVEGKRRNLKKPDNWDAGHSGWSDGQQKWHRK